MGIGKPCISLYTIVFGDNSARFGERVGHIKRDEIESFFTIWNNPRLRELRITASQGSSRDFQSSNVTGFEILIDATVDE